MKLPWISRYRLDAAEKHIALLEDQVSELKKVNAQLRELAQEEKEARREAEKKHDEKPEDSTTRKPRVFGADVRNRATAAATERFLKEGKRKN